MCHGQRQTSSTCFCSAARRSNARPCCCAYWRLLWTATPGLLRSESSVASAGELDTRRRHAAVGGGAFVQAAPCAAAQAEHTRARDVGSVGRRRPRCRARGARREGARACCSEAREAKRRSTQRSHAQVCLPCLLAVSPNASDRERAAAGETVLYVDAYNAMHKWPSIAPVRAALSLWSSVLLSTSSC